MLIKLSVYLDFTYVLMTMKFSVYFVFERSTGVELLLLLINFLKTRGGDLISLFDAVV